MATVVHVCDWCEKKFVEGGILLRRVEGEHWAEYAFCCRKCERAWHRNIATLPNPGIDTGRDA